MNTNSDQLHYSLITDIGGTNTRMQLISFTKKTTDPTVIKSHKYSTKEAKSLSECITDFLKDYKGKPEYPASAIIALAGAPFEGKVWLANAQHWPVLDEKEVAKEFEIKHVKFINDFVAIGYSMIEVDLEGIQTLFDVKPVEGATKIVAGAGTGLGECALLPQTKEGEVIYTVFGTEGGHKNFAPTTQDEWDYLNYCKKEDPFVRDQVGYLSTEKAFCGPGIPNIYRFLSKK